MFCVSIFPLSAGCRQAVKPVGAAWNKSFSPVPGVWRAHGWQTAPPPVRMTASAEQADLSDLLADAPDEEEMDFEPDEPAEAVAEAAMAGSTHAAGTSDQPHSSRRKRGEAKPQRCAGVTEAAFIPRLPTRSLQQAWRSARPKWRPHTRTPACQKTFHRSGGHGAAMALCPSYVQQARQQPLGCCSSVKQLTALSRIRKQRKVHAAGAAG